MFSDPQGKVGNACKNNLKKAILDQSNGKVDIGHAASFKQLQMVYADVPRRIRFKGESQEVIKAVKDRSEKTRTRLMNNFREYCSFKQNPVDVELLIERAMSGDCITLENALLDFFSELRVTQDGKSLPPKRSSILAFKSHIKRWILTHSDGKVDIGSPFTFKKLDEHFTARWHKNPVSKNFGKLKGDKPQYAKSTEKARRRMVRHFTTYFASKENPVDIDFLIEVAKDGDIVPLEKGLIEFFQVLCVQVDGKNKAPKRGTIECYKSHIKMSILEKTGGKVDIGNTVSFGLFNKFYSEYNGSHPPYMKDVKRRPQGKPIPPGMQGAIHTLLGNLLSVLETRGTDLYDRNLLKLPTSCHHTYHDLLRMAVMYVVVLCDVHRGQESLAAMRKNMYFKRYDPATEKQWFERSGGGGNFDIEFCGVIPFHSDSHGFNPGKLMDFYLSRLHPENRSLFQKHVMVGKKFDLHESQSDHVPWYTNVPTGKNSISLTLPSLCKLAGVPVFQNRNVRYSGIQMLKGLGYHNIISSQGIVDTLVASEEYQDGSDLEDELDSFDYKEVEMKPNMGPPIGLVVPSMSAEPSHLNNSF